MLVAQPGEGAILAVQPDLIATRLVLQHDRPARNHRASRRLGAENAQLHQRIAVHAANKGMTINRYIAEILEKHAADAA